MIERAGVEHVELIAGEAELILKGLPEYKHCPFDLQHTVSMLNMYLSLPSIGCFFQQVNGAVVGFIMSVVSHTFYSPRVELAELFFWVREDYRTTRLSLQLIRKQESWAKSVGALRMSMSASSGYETERIVKFYNKLGYRTTGVACTKEV